MPHFDPHRPHSEVHGIVGVRYMQDGHTFNSSGEHMPDPEAGTPNIDPGPTVTETKVPKADDPPWPVMQRGPDGNWVEPVPPVILGPDGLPAKRDEEPPADGFEPSSPVSETGNSTAELSHEPQAPPKDDMRLKENKMVKIQWEQYHEGEEFPGVSEARRILGIS